MQPFNLPKKEIAEIFKSSMPKNTWPAGAFDYQMNIYMDLTNEQKDNLCEWLCHNCKENFYVSERTTTRLAGGCTDNLVAWQQRNHPGIYKNFDSQRHLEIRLSANDIVLFRLVWVPND